jgi:hypothetical protein
MTKEKDKKDCFIIMPITTPKEMVDIYRGDKDHFIHVLERLFIPAIEKAGFHPIPPISKGSELILTNIITHLTKADLVLCDMSILNPNVFFEFGIRTALHKPVALVIDDITEKIPFDTTPINHQPYRSSLFSYEIEKDIDGLHKHIEETVKKSEGKNPLWKHFAVTQTGSFHPESASIEDKFNLILSEIIELKKEKKELISGEAKIHPINLKKVLNLSDKEWRVFLSEYMKAIGT